MLFIWLWLGIITAICFCLLCTSFGRSFCRVLIGHGVYAWRRTLVCIVAVVALLGCAVHLFSRMESFNGASFNISELRSFARNEIRRGVLEGVVTFGDSLSMLTPELAAVVPTAVMCLREISGKEIVPVLTATEPYGMELQILGFKSFKNRGINTRKLLQKRLGRNYEVFSEESSAGSFIKVYYNGKSWDEERLLALPAYRAAYRANVKAENVMAFVAVAENFRGGRVNFMYEPNFVGLDSVARLLKVSEVDSTDDDCETQADRDIHMFKKAFYAIAEPFFAPGDSASADTYARSALRYAEYYKRFGL